MNKNDLDILKIALPAIVTNITVPLLGLIDSAIVGHMGAAAYIGAVAVGSMIFNLVYWVFGFLRMGTSGMTAQARGRRDLTEVVSLLERSATVSLTVAFLLILLQWPIGELMLEMIGATPDVRPLAATYFYMVVWGAPASLGLFTLTGWFIGMQNTRLPMLVSMLQNVVNILVSLFLGYCPVCGIVYGCLSPLALLPKAVARSSVVAKDSPVAHYPLSARQSRYLSAHHLPGSR